ncbi:hypothetical protein MCHI_002087 [Candidatus Magnetoovum chiemensis]|nr:hypothetical protein MCHI_002087 [Candidatus Magnetoovum chiemensis]
MLDKNKDDMLGKVITQRIIETSAKTECLELEDIAAFIDKRLKRNDSDRVMRHLATCPECYEIYNETVETMEEMEEIKVAAKPATEPVPIWQKWRYTLAPIALAAAAMLIIMTTSTVNKSNKGKSVYTAGYAQKITTRLKEPDLRLALSSIRSEGARSFAFNAGLPPEAVLFRLGVSSVDFEIASRAGDFDKTLQLLKLIVSYIETVEPDNEKINVYKKTIGDVEASRNLHILQNTALSIIFKEKHSDMLFSFGQWTEAAKAAAITNKMEFFNPADIATFQTSLNLSGYPRGVGESLTDIDRIIKQGQINETDKTQVIHLLSNIITLF